MRKQWESPRLIIIKRGTSDDHVLQVCKYPFPPGPSGPQITATGCKGYVCIAFTCYQHSAS